MSASVPQWAPCSEADLRPAPRSLAATATHRQRANQEIINLKKNILIWLICELLKYLKTLKYLKPHEWFKKKSIQFIFVWLWTAASFWGQCCWLVSHFGDVYQTYAIWNVLRTFIEKLLISSWKGDIAFLFCVHSNYLKTVSTLQYAVTVTIRCAASECKKGKRPLWTFHNTVSN